MIVTALQLPKHEHMPIILTAAITSALKNFSLTQPRKGRMRAQNTGLILVSCQLAHNTSQEAKYNIACITEIAAAAFCRRACFPESALFASCHKAQVVGRASHQCHPCHLSLVSNDWEGDVVVTANGRGAAVGTSLQPRQVQPPDPEWREPL